jgi:hypothetical protein
MFSILYSTLLHLPPLRFHCVGGCWDRTSELAVMQTLHPPRLDLIHQPPPLKRKKDDLSFTTLGFSFVVEGPPRVQMCEPSTPPLNRVGSARN